MSLRRFQESFSRFLLEEKLSESFGEFSRELADSGRVSPQIGFGAYRGNWVGGLVSALADFFPTARELIGAECFDMLAVQFAKKFPAMCGNLNDYGEFFPNFLAEELGEVPAFAEMAGLDWRWHKLFYERDEDPINATDLALAASTDPEILFFELPRGMKFAESAYPLLNMRRYAQQPQCHRDDALLSGDGCKLILWRLNYERRIEALDATAWNFLKAIQAGLSFQDIAETVFSDLPEAALGSMFGNAIAKGWIVGIRTTV